MKRKTRELPNSSTDGDGGLRIETRATDSLKPYPDNPRINDAAVDAVALSIKEFGFRQPIVVDGEGVIVCGHTRWKAAHKLGLEEVPVHVAADLTPAQARAYRLADNKTHDLSAWNQELLGKELSELIGDFDMTNFGFEEPEGEPADAEPQIDRAEELNKKWKVKSGDLWQIGEHRLLCGDSTKAEDVARVMGGEKAAMAFQDPPYALYGTSTGIHGVADDNMIVPFFRDIAESLIASVARMGHIYSCCDWHSWSTVERVFEAGGIIAKNMIVWDKGSPALGQTYRMQHELVFFGIVAAHNKTRMTQGTGNNRAITDGNVWQFGRVAEREHNAQKPVKMVERALGNSSDASDLVVDPFLGSGTTMVACENLKRKCRGIEISPAYCAVTLERMATAFPGIEIKRL